MKFAPGTDPIIYFLSNLLGLLSTIPQSVVLCCSGFFFFSK